MLFRSRAEVRRQWPSSLLVNVEEHVPVAFWGQATGQLVNSYGEIFTASMTIEPTAPMPFLYGPPGLSQDMLSYYQKAEAMLKPLGRVPRALNISPRLAVQIRLDDGMVVDDRHARHAASCGSTRPTVVPAPMRTCGPMTA